MDLLQALAEIDELAEDVRNGAEAYAEIYAEYRGEIARFGDAWPGSAIQIANGHRAQAAAEARLAAATTALEATFPVLGPPAPAPEFDPTEPF